MAKNEYDDLLLGNEGQPSNEYDGLLAGEKSVKKVAVRASLMGSVDVNPDTAARARQVAKQTGMPEDLVERNLPQVESKLKLNEYDALLETAPKLRDQMADKNFAKVAHDDLRNLGQVEKLIVTPGTAMTAEDFGVLVEQTKARNPTLTWDEARLIARQSQDAGVKPDLRPKANLANIVKGLSRGYALGSAIGYEGLRQQFADLRGDSEASLDAGARADLGRKAMQEGRPRFETKTAAGIYSGGESFLAQAPGLAMSLLSRSPAPSLAMAGVSAESEAYSRYRNRGASAGQAFVGATGEGAIEVGTELLPMSYMVKKFGRAGAGQFLTGLLAREVPTEQIATFTQDAIDTAIANPDKTWAEFLAERPDAAYQTLVATITQAGTTSALSALAEIATSGAQRAQQAEDDFKKLSLLNEAIAQSKLVARDPDSFKQFVENASKDTPLQDLYVDARTFSQIVEANGGLDQLAQTMPETAQQLDEALAVGGDLRIPVAEYATHLATSPINTELLPNLRTSPESLSQLEAQAYFQTQAEQFQAEATRVLAEREQDTAWQQSAANVQQGILQQLESAGRFTPDVNRAYANLMRDFYTVTAQKLGITPEEMAARYPLQIRAKGLDTDNTLDMLDQGGPYDDQFAKITLDYLKDTGFEANVTPRQTIKVYHGTSVKNATGITQNGKFKGYPFFTPDRATAERYARQVKGQPTVLEIEIEPSAVLPTGGYLSARLEGLALAPDGVWRIDEQTKKLNQSAPQTESAEFKRWFKDSKVVDENGKPLVVYHGGPADMTGDFAFDPRKMGSNASAEGYGFYFTTDESTASGYKPQKSGSVAKVYLSVQKPLPVSAKPFSIPELKKIIKAMVDSEVNEFADEIADYRDSFLSNYIDTYSNSLDASVSAVAKMTKENNDFAVDQIAELANVAGDKLRVFEAVRSVTGYDGVVSNGYGDQGQAGGTIFVAWFPEQIKSAVSNRGTFDPADANILNQSAPQTESAEFKRWFGDWQDPKAFSSRYPKDKTPVSYVVDAEGRPLVVYHGTNADFNTFEVGRIGTNSGTFGAWETRRAAVFFSPDSAVAQEFANQGDRVGGRVVPVYLRIAAPLDMRDGISAELWRAMESANLNPRFYLNNWGWEVFDYENNGDAFVEFLKSQGYDGAILDGEDGVEYAVFSPEQIKSAVGNRGTFDPTDANILNQSAANEYGRDDSAQLADIVNAIPRDAPVEEKIAALRKLTDENEPLIAAFLKRIDAEFGTQSKSSRKADANIASKARRPSIKAEKPWFDIEHVRDSFRFKTVLESYAALPEIAARIQTDLGAEIIKVDLDKVLNPREWGWRIAAFDLRMPNGQLVEYYMPVREQEAYKKSEGHKLFEDWRNKNVAMLTPEELGQYQAALEKSYEGYETAWRESIARTGQDETAIRALLAQAAASAGSLTRTNSSLSSSAENTLLDQTPSSNDPNTPLAESSTMTRSGAATDLDTIISSPPFNESIAPSLTNAQLKQTRRGFISFGDDITKQASVITLLKDADLSTFLHETGHFYLEVLADIVSRPGAPVELINDFETAVKWMGVESRLKWYDMSFEERREYHERFARGFEAYLFEGRSPNTEMRGVFQRFRAWLVSIYKTLTTLNVELSDEVRGVFDRLIASEEDIKAAEAARAFAPLFKSAQEAGMTAEEWKAYQALGAEATEQAVSDLQRRSMRDMQYLSNAKARILKQLQKDAAAKRKLVREEVQAEVQAEPVYAAQRFLKRGEIQNGGEVIQVTEGNKLSLPALKEMYPQGELGAVDYVRLGYGQYGMLAEDGLHPDMIAEMFGFTSGDELVRTILDAQPINDVIEAVTDQRMLERYGDLASDAEIERAANEAIHNEARGRFIATELRQLEKALGPRKTLIEAAKEYATSMIMRRRVRDLRPAQYTAAESKAGKAAEKARIAGDLAVAAAAKREQLLQHYAAKAALDAVNQTEKSVDYLRKFNNEGTRKNLDADYLDQIDALLERFDLRRGQSLAAIDKKKTLVEWTERQRELGFEPDIDEALLNEASRKHFRDMTVEELQGLVDTVRNIEHLGRLKKKLLTLADKRELQAAVDEAAATIEANATKAIPDKLERNRLIDRIKEGANEYLAMHRKFASIIRVMDGQKDNGPLWNLFVRTMNGRANQEAVAREQATMKLSAIFEPVLKDGGMRQKQFIPEINNSLSREGRLMIALNWGNETNRLRVLEGERWTPAQAKAVLDTLTKEEWDFVQNVWDYIGTYWPDIAAKERRITGNTPGKVDAAQVETPFGIYQGGYFPIKYDPTRSTKAEADNLAEVVKQSMQGLYTRATTRRGHTKARVDSVKRPVRKDFGVIFEHIDQVVHDLSWHEWLIDVNRLLGAGPVDEAIRRHYGPETLKVLKDTIKDIAAGDIPATNVFERSINHLRAGVSIAGMGWNLFTSLLQPLGLSQSMVRVGPKWVAKGVARWMKDAATMESTVEWIYSRSDFMRLRGKTMQREINEIRNKVTSDNKLSPVKDSFFYLIQKAQMIADVPTWIGAYEKAMDSGSVSEEQAAALADQAVLDSQGGGQIKDLAGIQRGGPLLKLWTNFYSYFNVTYNLTVEAAARTKFTEPGQAGRFAVDMLLLYTLPAVMGLLIKDAIKVMVGGEDWDEEKLLARLAREQMNYLVGTMVGLRELGSAVQGFQGYNGPAGTRFFSEIAKLVKQVDQGEADMAAFKALNNVGGIVFHYPAGAVERAVEGMIALKNGDTANPAVLLTGYKLD